MIAAALRRVAILSVALAIFVPCGYAQRTSVTGHIRLVNKTGARLPRDASPAVVWLTPLSPSRESNPPRRGLTLVQKNKNFEPHLLVVPVGTVVEFPNHDPFFHNVFSLFEGKRFDLGLYEAGASRNVRFDRVGISYIFCNIHPQMSAVIIALDTRHYAISDRSGAISMPDVPPGRYLLHVWHERASQEHLKGLTREITISPGRHVLDELRIEQSETLVAHKNKYGRDYDPTDSQSAYKPQ